MTQLQSKIVAFCVCVLTVSAWDLARAAGGDPPPPPPPPAMCTTTGATQLESGNARTCVPAGAQGAAQCMGELQNWNANGPPQAAVNEAARKCRASQTCTNFTCPVQGQTCKGTTVAANAGRAQQAGPFASSPHCAATPNTPDECIITAPFMCQCACL